MMTGIGVQHRSESTFILDRNPRSACAGTRTGEQFALPEAVGALRAVRRREPPGQLVAVSGVDPLNLAGIVTSGDLVPAVATNRVLYRDGVPVAVREGGRIRPLADWGPLTSLQVERALVRRRLSEPLKAHLQSVGALGRL